MTPNPQGRPVVKVLALDEYQLVNLRHALDLIYAYGEGRTPCDAPISRLNNGDWVGELYLQLADVPATATPNQVYGVD